MSRLQPPSLSPDQTLPDHLSQGLKLLFIGINPGYYSAQVGHYYARPGNLFWWALSNSGLLPQMLGPENDEKLLEFKIGLTEVALGLLPGSIKDTDHMSTVNTLDDAAGAV